MKTLEDQAAELAADFEHLVNAGEDPQAVLRWIWDRQNADTNTSLSWEDVEF